MEEGKSKNFLGDIMGKLNELTKVYGPKAVEAAKVLAEEAQKGGKIGAEKLQQLNLERQKLQLFIEIGKTVYQMNKKGTKLDPALDKLCAKISEAEEEIRKHGERAKDISKTLKMNQDKK